ncbi:ABC transporter substrate-binding protein [Marinivivus vitaminiproducens]|uniref:ABC transporter substrate-binding protein n=1 Tax=Marinivivus vitaminiproducens TaxID=3035935 RepID=UPI00279FE665|nr:ABC transporter substrate-binding protein [Geminicoccaceae bacterium SCSIO 64248]
MVARLLACLLAPVLVAIGVSGASAAEGWPRTVTDILGREVTIEREPQRVLLTEGFQLVSLSLIDDDPVARLVGLGGDLETYSPALYAAIAERFPAIADVQVVGAGAADSLSLEMAVAVEADIAIVSAWQVDRSDGGGIVAALESAGIPVVVVDFFNRPLERTLPSLRALGLALGEEDGANAFAAFYGQRLARVTDRLEGQPPVAASVMLHAYPGHWPCCWVSGNDNLGEFLDLLGSRNIAASRFPDTVGGQVSLEYVLAEDPQVYIATGLPDLPEASSLKIGPGVPDDIAREALGRVVDELGMADLRAARDGRVFGIWNFLNGGPLSIVTLEAFARWIRPDLFGDVDPAATMAEINQRFAAVPLEGTFTVELRP